MKVTSLRHPDYYLYTDNWEKYRLAYAGGRDFIEQYLQRFSRHETAYEYSERMNASYCPAHAKTAVNEVKDAISERLVDVLRIGGPVSYQTAITGLKGGVDRYDSTMNGFMSCEVLPELLSMAKIGVYVDKPRLPENATRAMKASPYLYTYKAEDILAWDYDESRQLKTVLLQDYVYDYDKETSLPTTVKNNYRLVKRTEAGIEVKFFDAAGTLLDTELLALSAMPIAIFEIQQSLMTDIADYQIALLNLGSSDLSYAIRSNFPFYTEQVDPRDMSQYLVSTDTDKPKEEIKTGVAQGRKYPKGVDRPGFIHPSSEPLTASMAKQKELQDEIRRLVRLAVQSLASSSSESKKEDARSVESGLATIGAELEKGERKVAAIWADYEGDEAALIKYPESYSLRSDAERRAEADMLLELMPKLPSEVLRKEIAKQVARILVGHRVSQPTLMEIDDQIEATEVMITDPEQIRLDHEEGLVGTELASKLRGYPLGEVERAKTDHLDRIKRIVIAQGGGSAMNSARGVGDLDVDSHTAENEKKVSRQTDLDDTVTDKTRGPARE